MRIATYTAVAVLAAVAGASAVAAPSTVPHSLVGCWHRNVPAGGGGIPGIWHIWIRPSGAFAAANPSSQKCNGYQDFSGHITVSNSTLTIGPLPVCSGSASYTWTANATTMMLHHKKDGCPIRIRLFEGTWKKG